MKQPKLAPATDAPIGTDPFAAVRAAYPQARLILLLDRRAKNAGDKHMLAMPPSSAWHALLPPEQICDITEPGSKVEGAPIRAGHLQILVADPETIVCGDGAG